MSLFRVLASATVAAAAAFTTMVSPASAADRPLDGSGDFAVDGVHIRSGPGTGYPSRGLGYRSHGLRLDCADAYNKLTWFEVQDRTTGVRGWSHRDYIYGYCN